MPEDLVRSVECLTHLLATGRGTDYVLCMATMNIEADHNPGTEADNRRAIAMEAEMIADADADIAAGWM